MREGDFVFYKQPTPSGYPGFYKCKFCGHRSVTTESIEHFGTCPYKEKTMETHVIGKVAFDRGSVHLWWDCDKPGEHDFSCLQDKFENAMDGGLENHILNHGWVGLSISIGINKDGCPTIERVWLDRPLEVEIEEWLDAGDTGDQLRHACELLMRAAKELRELREENKTQSTTGRKGRHEPIQRATQR